MAGGVSFLTARAQAPYLVPPAVFLPHGAERQFIGPAVLAVHSKELWMLAPWGRPPVDFYSISGFDHIPHIYRSRDGGRTWTPGPRLAMDWNIGGYISDGGISLIRLNDRRLMLTFHRHVPNQHGGGIPAVSFSSDNGVTWSSARLVHRREQVCYVMNERTIQLASGRIVIPVAFKPSAEGAYREGDVCDAACFLSDDGGAACRLSSFVRLADKRGMAEPAVAEVRPGSLVMLARTGSGSHHVSFSVDGGESWSAPRPTSLTAACSPLTLKRMPDGALLVAYNHARPLSDGAFFPRRPLVYSVSRDGGHSWTPPVVIDDAPRRQLIYPSITFLDEGILFLYSEHFARDDGQFSGPSRDADKLTLGGARRCIIGYPHRGKT